MYSLLNRISEDNREAPDFQYEILLIILTQTFSNASLSHKSTASL